MGKKSKAKKTGSVKLKGGSSKSKSKKTLTGKAVDVAVSALKGGIGGKKARAKGTFKKKSAKQLLKRAYEKKAKRFIQIGNLGQARRTLRKKATVV